MPRPSRSYSGLRKRIKRLTRGPTRQGASSMTVRAGSPTRGTRPSGNPTGNSPGFTLRKRGVRVFEDGSSRKVKTPRRLNKVSSGLGYQNWKTRKPRVN